MQLAGKRCVIGFPFVAALELAGNEPSWHGSTTPSNNSSLYDLVEGGEFYVILEEGCHCSSPPGMLLWEFTVSEDHSLTVNYGSCKREMAAEMRFLVRP